MDAQELLTKGEAFFSKLHELAGPLSELAPVAEMFLPASASAVLKETVKVAAFVEANKGALVEDITKLAQDGEKFYQEFKLATGL